MDGTYLERPRPDVMTIYFQDGEFRTSATVEGKGLASKEAMGRYCLDEGIGIFDKNRTSNLQTANNDVAHTKDSRLQELVNSKSNRIPKGVKRRYGS